MTDKKLKPKSLEYAITVQPQGVSAEFKKALVVTTEPYKSLGAIPTTIRPAVMRGAERLQQITRTIPGPSSLRERLEQATMQTVPRTQQYIWGKLNIARTQEPYSAHAPIETPIFKGPAIILREETPKGTQSNPHIFIPLIEGRDKLVLIEYKLEKGRLKKVVTLKTNNKIKTHLPIAIYQRIQQAQQNRDIPHTPNFLLQQASADDVNLAAFNAGIENILRQTAFA